MKLSELLSGLCVEARLVFDTEIKAISEDSRKCYENSLFVCIEGEKLDGHGYIGDAYSRGARCFAVSRKIAGYDDCNIVFVENTRKFLAEASFFLYGNPQNKLKIIAVTGTKGKSSTALALYHILTSLGKGAALIGTLGAFGFSSGELFNTTPTPPTLAAAFYGALSCGAEYFILEVSSQAIKHQRLYSLKIDAAIFTNIGLDHVGDGEHESFSEYLNAKRRLFTDFGVSLAVVNSDDEYAEFISSGVQKIIRVGGGGDRKLSDIFCANEGVSFCLEGNFCNTEIFGSFNAYNLSLAAMTASELLKIPISVALSPLRDFQIPGRCERINHLGRIFVIDYAHNAMSAEALLSECRRLTEGRLIAVFGSVGERSFSRRGELAEVISRLADFSVITSDNPNFESPEKICREIAAAMKKEARFVCVTDRGEAIRYAFAESREGDLIALLGKGQEKYQTVRGEKIPFCERDIILSLRE